MDPKRRAERIAHSQFEVITTAQLLDCGLSRAEIKGLVERRILHPLHRGVYAWGRRHVPVNGLLLAAQLACAEGAYITRDSALGYHKVRGQYVRRIEVCVPGKAIRQREPPIVVRSTRTPPDRDELTHNGPLRIAKIPRALLDLAPDTPPLTLKNHITEAIHAGKLNHAEMLGLLERYAGHVGIGTLKRAYAYYLPRPNAKSGLEKAFDAYLPTRPWIPEPERNIYMQAGGKTYEIDRFFSRYGVACELDGRNFHQAQKDRERDLIKDARLAAIGIVVIRISDVRFDLEPGACFDDLEAVLYQRGWPGRPLAA